MNQLTFNKNQVVSFMVGGNFSADPGWQHKTRYHHGDYELMVCVRGQINLRIGTDSVILNPNEVLIVPPYTFMRGTQVSTTPVEFYWLHFLVSQTKSGPNKNDQISPTDRITLQNQAQIDDLSPLLIPIHELLAVDASEPFAQEQQNLLMTLILIRLANLMTVKPQESSGNALVEQLKEWIRTNIYRSPTLADIAAETELNPQYVSRVFKKHVGMSPKHYMIHLKIQTAQALLIRTNLSIKEVGSYSYYSDDKLFMKQFKQLSGVTPSEFRTMYQKVYHNNQVIDPVLPIPEEITQKLDDDRDPGSPRAKPSE